MDNVIINTHQWKCIMTFLFIKYVEYKLVAGNVSKYLVNLISINPTDNSQCLARAINITVYTIISALHIFLILQRGGRNTAIKQ